ncbi:MAG TPA: hypothetical protein VFC39_05165 [Acidobacteriaceae bacterium]|nr:hypothetical protein [Acidobacteriaceae bacterium]
MGNKADEGASHYVHSTLRERIVEHVFVGAALKRLWQRGVTDVEVLRSEFDAGGYDLVMSYRKIVRHIQFKTTSINGKAANIKAGLKLMDKPSGCIIWIFVTPELEFDHYRWFGSDPGQPLPDIQKMKIAKHTKGNAKGEKAERPEHRIIPLGKFVKLDSLDEVLHHLFGQLK